MATKFSLQQIEESIQKSKPEEQRELLSKLPHLLHIRPGDLGFLKVAEDSFEFWNNPTDTIYDSL